MLNILSFTPSITEFIQGSSDFFPTFIEINIRRKSVLRSFRNNISYPRIRNNLYIASNYMTSSRIAIHSLQSQVSGVLVSISRSETSLLKLKMIDLNGCYIYSKL